MPGIKLYVSPAVVAARRAERGRLGSMWPDLDTLGWVGFDEYAAPVKQLLEK
jgi:hypothetical protein